MGFELGEKAGGYEFLAILETSGTGLTYKVRNLLAQRPEVLKVLPKDLQQDRERVERFLREAKIHARLQHPNIASFFQRDGNRGPVGADDRVGRRRHPG